MNERRKLILCSTHIYMRGLDVWKWISIGLFHCCTIFRPAVLTKTQLVSHVLFHSVIHLLTVHLIMSAASCLSSTGIYLHKHDWDSLHNLPPGLCAAGAPSLLHHGICSTQWSVVMSADLLPFSSCRTVTCISSGKINQTLFHQSDQQKSNLSITTYANVIFCYV